MSLSQRLKIILIGSPIMFLVLLGIDWIKKDLRHSLYMKHIIPFADKELQQMSIDERVAITYETYEEIHLAACHLNSELLKISETGKFKPFTDDECIEMMNRARPFAAKLKARSGKHHSQSQTDPSHNGDQRSIATSEPVFRFPEDGEGSLNNLLPVANSTFGPCAITTFDAGEFNLFQLSNNSKTLSVSYSVNKESNTVNGVLIDLAEPQSPNASQFFGMVMSKLIESKSIDWGKVYQDVFTKNYDSSYKGFKPLSEGLILSQIPHTIGASNINSDGSFGIQFNRSAAKISDTESY